MKYDVTEKLIKKILDDLGLLNDWQTIAGETIEGPKVHLYDYLRPDDSKMELVIRGVGNGVGDQNYQQPTFSLTIIGRKTGDTYNVRAYRDILKDGLYSPDGAKSDAIHEVLCNIENNRIIAIELVQFAGPVFQTDGGRPVAELVISTGLKR